MAGGASPPSGTCRRGDGRRHRHRHRHRRTTRPAARAVPLSRGGGARRRARPPRRGGARPASYGTTERTGRRHPPGGRRCPPCPPVRRPRGPAPAARARRSCPRAACRRGPGRRPRRPPRRPCPADGTAGRDAVSSTKTGPSIRTVTSSGSSACPVPPRGPDAVSSVHPDKVPSSGPANVPSSGPAKVPSSGPANVPSSGPDRASSRHVSMRTHNPPRQSPGCADDPGPLSYGPGPRPVRALPLSHRARSTNVARRKQQWVSVSSDSS